MSQSRQLQTTASTNKGIWPLTGPNSGVRIHVYPSCRISRDPRYGNILYSDICDHLQFLSKALISLNTNQGNAVALIRLSDFQVQQTGGCGLGFITSSPHYNRSF